MIVFRSSIADVLWKTQLPFYVVFSYFFRASYIHSYRFAVFILILEYFSVFHYPLKSSINSIFFYHFIYLFIYLFQQEHLIFPVHSKKPGRRKVTRRLVLRALGAGECLSAFKKGQSLTTGPHLVRQTLKSFDYPLISSTRPLLLILSVFFYAVKSVSWFDPHQIQTDFVSASQLNRSGLHHSCYNDTSKSQPTAYCFAQLKQGTCLIWLKCFT